MTSPAGDVDIVALSLHVDSKRLSIAFLAWVVHELVITSGDAVNLVWMQSWNISKAIFFINQLAAVVTILAINALGILTIDSASVCAGLTAGLFVGSLVIVCIVCFILTVRVWALWKRSYIILTIFFLALAGNVLVFLIMYGLSLLRGTLLLFPPPFTGCTVASNSKILWIMFTTTLVFEALATGLIVYKSWPLARRRGVEAPLYSLLLEDGIGYCLVLIASKLFVVSCLYIPSVVATVGMPTCICVSVSSLTANRLTLRLHGTMLKKTSDWTDYTTAEFSIARNRTGGDDAGDKAIRTIRGSGKTGRCVRARRHSRVDDELFSLGGGEVEMSLNKREGELHATDSIFHSSTSLPTSTISGWSSNAVVPVIDSKECGAA